jgi:hypothetical protein
VLQAADLVVALTHRLIGALDDRAGLGATVGAFSAASNFSLR